MKKILSIGNSFSQDAHKWLAPICSSIALEIHAVNLFIPGCSLERHWKNYESEEQAYSMEVNGEHVKFCSLTEALQSETWDIITVQQVSAYSGQPQSYIPWLQKLATAVREHCSSSKLYIHETWAYEHDFQNTVFTPYHDNQEEMYARVHDAYKMASLLIDAPIIPTGSVIQELRRDCPAFQYRNGGKSLNRDGYHLTKTYGRYIAALTWCKTLFCGDIREVSFVPACEGENVDPALLDEIKRIIYEFQPV